MKKNNIIIVLLLSVFGLITIAYYLFFNDLETATPPSDEAKSVLGVDISHHNNISDWNAVADSIDFVIIKATEGGTFKDSRFLEYWAAAKKVNMLRGAYHFYTPSASAEEQFENFKNTVSLKKGDLVPFVDVENKEVDVNELNKWIGLARKNLGAEPVVYSEYTFFKIFLDGKVDCKNIWIYVDEKYGRKPSFKKYSCVFWQYSHTGKVKGIEGNVDRDIFIDSSTQISGFQMK